MFKLCSGCWRSLVLSLHHIKVSLDQISPLLIHLTHFALVFGAGKTKQGKWKSINGSIKGMVILCCSLSTSLFLYRFKHPHLYYCVRHNTNSLTIFIPIFSRGDDFPPQHLHVFSTGPAVQLVHSVMPSAQTVSCACLSLHMLSEINIIHG